MNKSATGTEYVNAQAEDLKDDIDQYAKEIAEMSSGAMYGMVYIDAFQGSNGVIMVSVVGEQTSNWINGHYDGGVWIEGHYEYHNRYTLRITGAFNAGGGGLSRSVDTKIPQAALPTDDVTVGAVTKWYDYSPEVSVTAELTSSGRLHLSVGANPDGQFDAYKEYYHD